MKRFTSTLLVLFTLIGVFIGICISKEPPKTIIIAPETNKIDELMKMVRHSYVDTLDMTQIIEETMPKILEELDPHSKYIPLK